MFCQKTFVARTVTPVSSSTECMSDSQLGCASITDHLNISSFVVHTKDVETHEVAVTFARVLASTGPGRRKSCMAIWPYGPQDHCVVMQVCASAHKTGNNKDNQKITLNGFSTLD